MLNKVRAERKKNAPFKYFDYFVLNIFLIFFYGESFTSNLAKLEMVSKKVECSPWRSLWDSTQDDNGPPSCRILWSAEQAEYSHFTKQCVVDPDCFISDPDPLFLLSDIILNALYATDILK
jgi:hypothetical protein